MCLKSLKDIYTRLWHILSATVILGKHNFGSILQSSSLSYRRDRPVLTSSNYNPNLLSLSAQNVKHPKVLVSLAFWIMTFFWGGRNVWHNSMKYLWNAGPRLPVPVPGRRLHLPLQLPRGGVGTRKSLLDLSSPCLDRKRRITWGYILSIRLESSLFTLQSQFKLDKFNNNVIRYFQITWLKPSIFT